MSLNLLRDILTIRYRSLWSRTKNAVLHMQNDSASSKFPTSVLYATSTISTACLLLFLAYVSGFYDEYPDIEHYVTMSQGKFGQAGEPYASRVLGPLLANLVTRLTDIPAMKALAVVNATSFILFFASAGHYLRRNEIKLADSQIFLITPYSFVVVKYLYVPDAIGIMLCFLFIIFSCERKNSVYSSIFAVLTVMARKTFFVPIFFIVLLKISHKKLLSSIVLLFSIIVGFLLIYFIVGKGGANRHGMNMISYYILKIPANLLGNILGIDMYTNTYQWCEDPIFVFDVSKILFIGNIDIVGLCYPSFMKIARTLFVYAVIFGMWPFVAMYILIKCIKGREFRDVSFIIIAGTVSLFLLSAGFGRTVERLFIYSYPFLIYAGPALINFARESRNWHLVRYGTIAIQGIGIVFFFAS